MPPSTSERRRKPSHSTSQGCSGKRYGAYGVGVGRRRGEMLFIKIPPGKDRWLATPNLLVYHDAPYKSPPFGSCAIYFNYGVIAFSWQM